MTATNAAQSKRTDREKVLYLTLAGVFAAMIYLLTAFVKVPTGAGYTHAGDSAVFLAACLLPAADTADKSQTSKPPGKTRRKYRTRTSA